jgi:RimJ/RimL family protein N-acetyltransferase
VPNHRDVFALVELANDAELARKTGFLPHPFRFEDGRRLIDGRDPDSVCWSICLRDDTVAGMAGLQPGLSGEASLICWLGRPFWGQGLAIEAAHAAVLHGFRNMKFQRITALSFDHDAAAGVVLRRLGFRRIRPSRKFCAIAKDTLPATRFEKARKPASKA